VVGLLSNGKIILGTGDTHTVVLKVKDKSSGEYQDMTDIQAWFTTKKKRQDADEDAVHNKPFSLSGEDSTIMHCQLDSSDTAIAAKLFYGVKIRFPDGSIRNLRLKNGEIYNEFLIDQSVRRSNV
jgi:hypothetical protein